MLIFCYGSNLCTGRLAGRVASARPVSTAVLRGHAFRFHKRSDDGSAKADAHATGRPEDQVWGTVVRIDPSEKRHLDRAEERGGGYAEKTVTVEPPGGGEREVRTYFALDVDSDRLPYTWYKRLVVEGARRHGLPEAYVREIEAARSREDPDRGRARRQLAVDC